MFGLLGFESINFIQYFINSESQNQQNLPNQLTHEGNQTQNLSISKKDESNKVYHNPPISQDIFIYALSFLNPEQTAIAERVCRAWHSMINSNNQHIWKLHFQIQGVINPAICEALSEYEAVNENGLLRRFDSYVLRIINDYDGDRVYPLNFCKNQFINPKPYIAFGKEKWEKYLGNVGPIPHLPSQIHKILNSPCPFWREKKVEQTHLLVLLPETLNGIRLSLDRLGEIMRNSKRNPTGFYYTWFGPEQYKYKDSGTHSSRWVLMTHDVLPQSRNKTYEEQLKLLGNFHKYSPPKLFEAAIVIFTNYIDMGMTRFRRVGENRTYTRCQESVFAQEGREKPYHYRMVLGGMQPVGLLINEPLTACAAGVAAIGLAAVRKL